MDQWSAHTHLSIGRFELLEQLSQHQEAAYERLYRWVQDRCQTLEEETPAADVTLQVGDRAVWALLRARVPFLLPLLLPPPVLLPLLLPRLSAVVLVVVVLAAALVFVFFPWFLPSRFA